MGKPISMTTNDVEVRRNPIIGEDRESTLFNAGCVADFLSAVHRDAADYAQLLATESLTYEPNEMRGMALVCGALSAALYFEWEGRE